MIISYLNLIIAALALIYATVIDLKIREVPDWLSHGLMIYGIAINIILSFITWSITPIMSSIGGLIIFFGIGYTLYRLNQWGGGDTKTLAGMGAIFGIYPGFFMTDFFINLLFAGAIYGIGYSIALAIKNRKKIKFKKIKYSNHVVALTLLTFILIWMLIPTLRMKILASSILLLMFISIYLLNFINILQQQIMIKKVSIKKLTEGDWIAQDIKVGKKIIAREKDNGLTKKQLNELNKLYRNKKIKSVLIKEGMPFLPSFLIAYILTITFGNIILLII